MRILVVRSDLVVSRWVFINLSENFVEQLIHGKAKLVFQYIYNIFLWQKLQVSTLLITFFMLFTKLSQYLHAKLFKNYYHYKNKTRNSFRLIEGIVGCWAIKKWVYSVN